LTLTEKLQEAPPESVAPLMLMTEVPAVAVIVWPEIEPVVQDGPLRPLGVSITRPLGRVSEKPTPVRAVVLGLAKVKVTVLALPWGMDVGEKALESVGTSGRGQPLMTTLSIHKGDVLVFAPAAWTKKRVLVVPVVAAGWAIPGT
jgi:hypothetical protein